MEYKELDASKYSCFHSSLTENNRRSQQIPRGKYGQVNVNKLQMSVNLKMCVCARTHACMCVHFVCMYMHTYCQGV